MLRCSISLTERGLCLGCRCAVDDQLRMNILRVKHHASAVGTLVLCFAGGILHGRDTFQGRGYSTNEDHSQDARKLCHEATTSKTAEQLHTP